MQRNFQFFLLIIASIVLVACTTNSSHTTGSPIDHSKVEQIVKEETTATEIKQWFGNPMNVAVVGENSEKWIYTHSVTDAASTTAPFFMSTKADNKQEILDILIKDGVVVNYTFNVHNTQIN